MTRDPFCQNSIDENVKMLELFRIITKYRWQGIQKYVYHTYFEDADPKELTMQTKQLYRV
jgi:hypothetical protein